MSMMKRYPRTPALLIVLVALSLGALYVTAWGRVEALWKKQPGEQSVEALEKRIADEQAKGSVSAATWFAYGNALADAKQWSKAATAYKEVLAIEPARKDAKFQCALALAQAGQADEFYSFQKELVYGEAKLAVELFERPEAQKYLAEDRFAALAREAKNQALD
jgi:cytochrome c-type biogenesis protein CcmH/NrfG